MTVCPGLTIMFSCDDEVPGSGADLQQSLGSLCPQAWSPQTAPGQNQL